MLPENQELISAMPAADQIAHCIEQIQNKLFIYEQLDAHSNKPIREYCQRLILADLRKDLMNGNIFKGIFDS
jgi:hypothetical protein